MYTKERTMKHIFIWATVLMMSVALFSCEKESKELEPSLVTSEEQTQQEKNVPSTLYTARSEMGSYDLIEDKADKGLRASVICKGYRKPEIDVTASEFQSKGIKAYWTIVGQRKATAGTVSKFLSTVPSKNKPPKINSLALTKEGGKRKLRMYAQVANDFDVKNKFAMLALDGTLRSNRYIDFTGAKAPNSKLQGWKKNRKLRVTISLL